MNLLIWLNSLTALSFNVSRIPSTDYPPQYLNSVTSAYDKTNNQLIIFGGYNSETDEFFSELYTFSLKELYWDEITPESDYIPPGLAKSNMVIYSNTIYIFYGKKKGGISGDIYSFSLDSLVWRLENLQGEKISGRVDSAFATFEYNNTVYAAMFGGLTHSEVSNELIL